MRVLKRLFCLLVPYRTTLAVSVVLLLVRAAVELLPPLFQRRIIDEVFAHRLSTVRNADKIIALKEGRILEVGDHQALVEQGGLYRQLYIRQLEIGGQEPF
jgi:ABC-type multidrug transport system fused ATPase/permease subunit